MATTTPNDLVRRVKGYLPEDKVALVEKAYEYAAAHHNGQTRVSANDVTALSFTGNSTTPSVVTTTMSVQRTLISRKLVPATPLQMTAQAEVRNA